MARQYRQGDVLLVPVASPQGRIREVPREQGRIVLAHGEVTGHAHAVEDEAARLVTDEEARELFLIVHGDDAVALSHEEHDTLWIDPGAYRVVRQREYEPSVGWDWVHD